MAVRYTNELHANRCLMAGAVPMDYGDTDAYQDDDGSESDADAPLADASKQKPPKANFHQKREKAAQDEGDPEYKGPDDNHLDAELKNIGFAGAHDSDEEEWDRHLALHPGDLDADQSREKDRLYEKVRCPLFAMKQNHIFHE